MTAVYINSTHTKAYANKKNHNETVSIEAKKYQKESDLEMTNDYRHHDNVKEIYR